MNHILASLFVLAALGTSSVMSQYCNGWTINDAITNIDSDGGETGTYAGWIISQQYCKHECVTKCLDSGCPTTGAYPRAALNTCTTSSKCPSKSGYKYNCSSPSCFAGDSTVETLGRGIVSISELKSGDFLKAYSIERKAEVFSRFTGYSHEDAQTHAKFLELTTASRKQLKLSELHLIMKQSTGEFVYAQELVPGDVVLTSGDQTETIVSIEETIERGVYAPLTEEGTVLVNGVVASCYANYRSHAVAHAVHPAVTSITNFVNSFFGYKDTTEMANELGLYAMLSRVPFLSGSMVL